MRPCAGPDIGQVASLFIVIWYESVFVPLAVLLSVSIALLAALCGLQLASLDCGICTQLGVVALIAHTVFGLGWLAISKAHHAPPPKLIADRIFAQPERTNIAGSGYVRRTL